MTSIQIRLKKNENIERALKRLKRLMDHEGILRQLKEKSFYEKPSDKNRKKRARARARAKKEAKENQ